MNIKNKAKKNTKSQDSKVRELNAQEIKAVSGGSIAGKNGEIIVRD
ncbi:hypothetical protein GCM10008107_16730 [Psychrosphaera saromensis]|nr:hypothetical protein [Psychrosphaera saromensis]GHB67920.1 hypothetical protein GCM10008107_16730 [Psychrosphaera saromensis]GLQ15129.1 hypothetical protein GCM10007917_25840 [Psychrosphaera saromensis]